MLLLKKKNYKKNVIIQNRLQYLNRIKEKKKYS